MDYSVCFSTDFEEKSFAAGDFPLPMSVLPDKKPFLNIPSPPRKPMKTRFPTNVCKTRALLLLLQLPIGLNANAAERGFKFKFFETRSCLVYSGERACYAHNIQPFTFPLTPCTDSKPPIPGDRRDSEL